MSDNTVKSNESDHVSLTELYKVIIENPDLDVKSKEKLLSQVRKLKPANENIWNQRSVIIALGIVAVVPLLFIMCSNLAEEINSILPISATAVGALAALITRER